MQCLEKSLLILKVRGASFLDRFLHFAILNKNVPFTTVGAMPPKSFEKDLTRGSLTRGILFFSIPLIFSNLLQVLFNIADIAVVGRFAGTIALGSVGSTAQILFLFTGLIMGIGFGINSIVAYFIGARSKKEIGDSVHTGFIISIVSGLLLALLGFIFAEKIMVLIKTKAELLEGAVTYFRIYILGLPGAALYNYGYGILSAAGDTKRPLYFLTFAGTINIILNLIFVISFKMDCAGVALASLISEYISAILTMAALCRGTGDIKFSFRKISLNRSVAKRILKVGIPSGMQNAIFAFANTFIQVGVNSFDAVMVAGTAAASNLDPIVYNAMGAFYSACATFIGQNYGAGNKKRIKDSAIIANAYSFVLGAAIGLCFYFFGRKLLGIFTADPEVIDAGMLRLKIMSFSYCFATFMDNTIAANRGLGKTFVPSMIVLAGSCLFRIIWIYTVFAFFKTIPSLFLLYIFSWCITAAILILYFMRQYRKI